MEKSFAQWVRSQKGRLLYYVDAARGDETPMPVAVVSTDQSEVSGIDALVAKALTSMKSGYGTHGPGKKVDAGPGKIYQSENKYGMLAELPAQSVQSKPSYVVVIGETIVGLQIVDRTTAETLTACHRMSSGISLASRMYEEKLRVSVVDKYAAGLKAERAFARELGPDWDSVAFMCDQHDVSGITSKVLSPVDSDITGMIRTALAASPPGAIHRFRNCFRKCVMAWILWPPIRGEPSAEALLYTQKCISALLVGPPILQPHGNVYHKFQHKVGNHIAQF